MSTFYYRGFLFHPETEDIYNPWEVRKINDITHIIRDEQSQHKLIERGDNYCFTGYIHLSGTRKWICEISNKKPPIFGFYNDDQQCFEEVLVSEVVNLTKEQINEMAYQIGKIGTHYLNNRIPPSYSMLGNILQQEWNNRKEEYNKAEYFEQIEDMDYVIKDGIKLNTTMKFNHSFNQEQPHYKKDSVFYNINDNDKDELEIGE